MWKWIVAMIALASRAICWEEDPRLEEHLQDTMRLLKLGDAYYQLKQNEPKEEVHEEDDCGDEPDGDICCAQCSRPRR
jgi:hypothetical protein